MKTNNWDNLAETVFDTTNKAKLHSSSADNIQIAHPAIIKLINSYFSNLNELKALDFGCGTGGFTQELSYKGIKVVGLDTSQSMIKIAKSRNIKNAEFINGTLGEIKDNTCFDLIVSVMVLQFVEDIEVTAANLCKLLKENGLIVIAVHNREYISECLKKDYKFHTDESNDQLEITLGDNIKIPLINRSFETYKQVFEKNKNIVMHNICTPPFTEEYINNYAVNTAEPINIPKYLIMSFVKN